MLTDIEIKLLKEQAKRLTCLYWRDADGVAHQVKGVKLNWIEDPDEPDLTEPVAVLASGKVVALHNVELSEFVTLQPLTLGEPHAPTRYVDRVMSALALLCHGAKPPRGMVEEWFRDESDDLQDWAVNNTALHWGTGIGTIEAAVAMAETPEEGISGGAGPEHQTREEAFPRETVATEVAEASGPQLTPLEHLKRAFELSDIAYTVREEDNGWTYLFTGDVLRDFGDLEGYTADTAPRGLLQRLGLPLYELYEGNLVSC